MWNLILHFLTFAGGMASGVMLDVSYAGWKREHGTSRNQTQRKPDG